MNDKITTAVREQYAATARSGLYNDSAGVADVARAFGYSEAELLSIPADANMGLSCGNPVALAHLKPGEVVVDLGSGGGLDVFLAAEKVGPTGRAIGIDMTPEMVARARRAAAKGVDGKPYGNVAFMIAPIDALPLADGSADVIVSNCVINLATDKSAVFAEMFRVLKPGGRVAVSDIALKRPLPAELAGDIAAYVGCIAGAISMADYEAGLRAAGFSQVAVVDARADLNAYGKVEGQAACCAPAVASDAAASVSACCTPAGSRTAAAASSAAEPAASGCCTPLAATAADPSPCCSPGASTTPVKSAGACCTPNKKKASLAVAAEPCCTPAASDGTAAKSAVHGHLADLLERYDVNEYAASVKVFAIKPA